MAQFCVCQHNASSKLNVDDVYVESKLRGKRALVLLKVAHSVGRTYGEDKTAPDLCYNKAQMNNRS